MSANTEKANQLEEPEPAKDTESNCDDEYDYDINNDEPDKLKNISESSSPTIAQSSIESEFESSENEEEKPPAKTKLANGQEPAEKETQPDEKSEPVLDVGKVDEEQQQAVDDANAAVEKLLNSVDYGIVLAFLDKFATHLGIKEYTFKSFESNLVNAKTGLIHL